MKNNTFSLQRLWLLIRINLTENARTLLMQVLVMGGIIFLWTAFIYYTNYIIDDYDYYGRIYDPMWEGMLAGMVFICTICGLISASQIGSVMSGKPKRLVNLMIPATQAEKFMARWLIYIVGYFLVFAALFFAVDLLRVIVVKATQPECTVTSLLINHTFENSADYLCGTLAIMLGMSIYTLGSFIWPKHPIVATTVASGVMYMVIGFICFIVIGSLIQDSCSFERCEELLNSDSFLNTMATVFALFFWWVAYLRYRQDEVVYKW